MGEVFKGIEGKALKKSKIQWHKIVVFSLIINSAHLSPKSCSID